MPDVTLEEALATLRAERQAEHDRTGVHDWIDISTFAYLNCRRFRCLYCEAEKTEPWNDEPGGDRPPKS